MVTIPKIINESFKHVNKFETNEQNVAQICINATLHKFEQNS